MSEADRAAPACRSKRSFRKAGNPKAAASLAFVVGRVWRRPRACARLKAARVTFSAPWQLAGAPFVPSSKLGWS
jgi:hypothetical protein